MARRYDSRTTTFSPDGRLFQVEYAMEAVGNAGTCLAILTSEGIVLGCERHSANKLLDDVFDTEKVFRVSEHMICGVAGLSSDANVLMLESRLIAQRYLLQYGFDIPCEQLVKLVSDVKQQYTQYGGKRPFGTSLLFVGWDEFDGYQLYLSDPSGNYSGWKATCIGRGSAACMPLLKQEYQDPMTLTSALCLATKVLAKNISSTKFRAESIELVTLVRAGEQTEVEVLGLPRLEKLVSAHKAEEEKAKQAEKAKAGGTEKMKTKPAELAPGKKTKTGDMERVEPGKEPKGQSKHPEKAKARRKGDHRGSYDEKHQKRREAGKERAEPDRKNERNRRGENAEAGKPEETPKNEEKDAKEQNIKGGTEEEKRAAKGGTKLDQQGKVESDQKQTAGRDAKDEAKK